ncbi:MAG TPA: hypothetical protein P5243_03570 [Bacteroidales bacterium]|nr:hypothetical protein [Bacteroidales bacterium]
MKRFLLIPIFTVICASLFAQGEIKNATHANFAWNRPIMNYGEQINRNSAENVYLFYQNQYQDFKHYGGSFEFGSSFYIHPTGFVKGFKAGVLVDFIDFGANYLTYTDSAIQLVTPTNIKTIQKCHDLTARYSLNVGAMTTYSPKKSIYFDLYFKLRPTFAVNYLRAPMWESIYDRIYTNENQSNIFLPNGEPKIHKRTVEETSIGLGLNYSYGINIRVAKVLVGAEIISGKLKYKAGAIIGMDQTVRDQYLKLKLGFFFAE